MMSSQKVTLQDIAPKDPSPEARKVIDNAMEQAAKEQEAMKDKAMSSQREDQQIRDFLRDDIVCSAEEDGFVEYTDAGVWITDQAVEKFKSIASQQARERAIEELEAVLEHYDDTSDPRPADEVVADRLAELEKEEGNTYKKLFNFTHKNQKEPTTDNDDHFIQEMG